MRILHTSDWHLGRTLDQSNISRIEEQREFIDCLCKIVEEEKIDLVLVAGDIYDTYNPSAVAEEIFYDAIDRLNDRGKRAVVVIAGNHDNPERLCAASPLAYKSGIILLGYPASDPGLRKISSSNISSSNIHSSNIQIIDSGPGWLELAISGCSHPAVILTMPYPSESRLEEVLSQEADEGQLRKAYSEKIGSIFSLLSKNFREDTINLAVGHLFLRGGKESESERTLQVGGALTVDPSILPSNAHFVALGHLHRPQEIRNAPCPVFYSGSPLAYSFSEAGYSKAVYIIDALPGEKAEIKPLTLDCGKPLSKWLAEEGIGQALKWCEDGRDANAWVDLEIVTDRVLTVEEQKRLRTLHPGIINIRPRLLTDNLEVIAPQNREGKRIDELFKDYYKFRMGIEISQDLMGAFVEIMNDEYGEFETEPEAEYENVDESQDDSEVETGDEDETENVQGNVDKSEDDSVGESETDAEDDSLDKSKAESLNGFEDVNANTNANEIHGVKVDLIVNENYVVKEDNVVSEVEYGDNNVISTGGGVADEA